MSVVILYGSQTGNARDVAEHAAREAGRRHYRTKIMPMDAFPVDDLPLHPFVVFFASTTGQGDPPSNMKRFWKRLLRKALGPRWLSGLHYAVFGLGDSGYPAFNIVAKKLDRRMLDLGASPMLPRGLGDDQHPSGYDAALDPWLISLWKILRQKNPLPLPLTLSDPPPDDLSVPPLDPPKFKINYHSQVLENNSNENFYSDNSERDEINRSIQMMDSVDNIFFNEDKKIEVTEKTKKNGNFCYGPWNPYVAKVIKNERLTTVDHHQDVRHIEFDLGNSGLRYEPGDILNIFPSQPTESVNRFLERCELNPNDLITVELADLSEGPQNESLLKVVKNPNGNKTSLNSTIESTNKTEENKTKPVRLSTFVASTLDVTSASPRRYFFEVLCHFAREERERERLQYFATAEGRDDCHRYNQREGRTVLEVLEDFPSAQIPLERLLQIVPRLIPRAFSISSSLRNPLNGMELRNFVSVTVAVVTWKSPFKRIRKGLCSNWMAGLSVGSDSAPIWFSKGYLSLPPPPIPLILIGPGTGCAPFRSFLQERTALKNSFKKNNSNFSSSENISKKNSSENISFEFFSNREGEETILKSEEKISSAAPILFFFGCRNKMKDFLYEDEFLSYSDFSKNGVLSEENRGGFFVAFSRDQPKKVYVQHKIREQSKKIWELLEKGAEIFVAGSASKMPTDVTTALEEVIEREGKLTPMEAKKWIRDLEKVGRLTIEAWS